MTAAIITPITKTSHEEVFEDKIVDNDGFFDAMEEGFSKTLSEPEIYGQTRLALHELLAQMKTQTFIHWVTEWTANEQKAFFEQVHTEIKKTHREIKNAGILALTNMREKIQTLIKDEIWREINDEGKKDNPWQYNLRDGNNHVIMNDIRDYQQFLEKSFLTANETRIIPLDLRLTIGKTETVKDAREKLKKYDGKYNALILVDEWNHPIGIIKADTLTKYEKKENMTLEKVEYISDEEIYWHYTTSIDDAKKLMQKFNINILPIVDTNTGMLIGILTSNSLVKKEVQYYSTVSLAKLSIDYMQTNI